jgi:hypothetical protein
MPIKPIKIKIGSNPPRVRHENYRKENSANEIIFYHVILGY